MFHRLICLHLQIYAGCRLSWGTVEKDFLGGIMTVQDESVDISNTVAVMEMEIVS